MSSFLSRALATAGGAGYSPIAPGTAGTLVAIPVAWFTATLSLHWFLALATLVTLIGVWAANEADRFWGTHDSGRIVIDEVAGYLITVALVDRSSFVALAAGFILFRLFDILKPFPIAHVDKYVRSGLGVMLDDVLAGIMAGVCLFLLDYFELLQMLTP